MKTLKNRLKEKLESCYLLEGEDEQLYFRALNMIKKSAKINLEDFNVNVFDDENYSMQAVIDACEVLPMIDEYKLVILKNIDKINENDKKMLQNYLKSPCESTIFVILDFYNKFNFVKNEVSFVNCQRLDKQTLSSVVVRELAQRGKQISGEALGTLIDYCDGYLTRIVCEMDKLVYYSAEPLITQNIVQELVSKNADVVIYELTDALGSKNADKALKMLETLKKESGILGLITSHFRRLFYISICDYSDSQLANLLSVKEYAIKKQRAQIKNFSKAQLKKIYALLEKVDYMIKSGAMLIENALFYLGLSILYI